MKWLDDIVNQILEKYPNEEEYVCACGISTTGIAHIGNFRELIITYFVAKELKRRGNNVKLVLSFDDFDRLKKVPFGIDKSYEQYVGMPNYSIPCPYDDTIKYAEYYEQKVIEELTKLGIKMQYIRQSDNYLNGKYIDSIKIALEKKDEIFDIVSKYKTQLFTKEDKDKYYPIKVYCSMCNKDTTVIDEYKKGFISYSCKCGYKEISDIKDLKTKLNFNVDWPMRWNYEKVNFEPCGKGHSDANGALVISKEINERIFKGQEPIITSYEFLNLKGNQGRMNKNSKDLITISDLLQIMPREMILWMFLIKSPRKEMTFSMEDDIIKLYNEFEKIIENEDNKKIREFLDINYSNNIIFNDLIKYLPIVNFNLDKLKEYVQYDENNKDDLLKIKYAINWLRNYSKNQYWNFLEKANYSFYNTLSFEDKQIIEKFKMIISTDDYNESLNSFLLKLKQNGKIKEFYNIIYNLLFGINQGIPLKKVLENFDKNKIIELLSFNKKEHNKKEYILHLSDLHFDINDSNTELFVKWDKMINTLKKSIPGINYFVLSGDIICFYNMHDNYLLAYKYIAYLIDELHIDKDKVMMCMGNHEMIAFNNFDETNAILFNFDKEVLPIISEYNDFYKQITGNSISSIKDMYVLKEFDLCDFMIINSLYSFNKDKRGIFLQDTKQINEILNKYDNNNKFKFLITHAGKNYNPDLFIDTNISDKFNMTLCGHKFTTLDRSLFNKNEKIEFTSGNTDGFVDKKNNYNIYGINDNILEAKKLIYKKDWYIK